MGFRRLRVVFGLGPRFSCFLKTTTSGGALLPFEALQRKALNSPEMRNLRFETPHAVSSPNRLIEKLGKKPLPDAKRPTCKP